jgi:hypothetical protein
MTVEAHAQFFGHESLQGRAGAHWFLLREDVEFGGATYRAGTPVQRSHDRWYLHGCDSPLSAELQGLVCQSGYGGLALQVVRRDRDGMISHRRIGSDEVFEAIPASRVISPPAIGHDRVYLAFGDQFYPLEYFGW